MDKIPGFSSKSGCSAPTRDRRAKRQHQGIVPTAGLDCCDFNAMKSWRCSRLPRGVAPPSTPIATHVRFHQTGKRRRCARGMPTGGVNELHFVRIQIMPAATKAIFGYRLRRRFSSIVVNRLKKRARLRRPARRVLRAASSVFSSIQLPPAAPATASKTPSRLTGRTGALGGKLTAVSPRSSGRPGR